MQGRIEDQVWDLTPLIGPGVKVLLGEAESRAVEFARRYANVGGLDAAGLAAAMRALGEITDRVQRVRSYVALRVATAQNDPALLALRQYVTDRADRIDDVTDPFWSAWNFVEPARADALLDDERLAGHADHLRRARTWRRLTDGEERIARSLRHLGGDRWSWLWEANVAAMTVQLAGRSVPLREARSRLHSRDRTVRRLTAKAIAAAHGRGLDVRARAFTGLMAYRREIDRIRGFPHWLAAQNCNHGFGDASVEAMIAAVQGRFESARRWYRLKAALCGLETLADCDRFAPLADDHEPEPHFDWATACDLLAESFELLSPRLADLVRSVLAARRVHAAPQAGKQLGGVCHWTVRDVGPYLLVNYTGRPESLVTVGHELGHAVHGILAQSQAALDYNAPAPTGEMAGQVGALLVLRRLLDGASTPTVRLRLLMTAVDDSLNVIFRHTVLHLFEQRAHRALRAERHPSADELNELWSEAQAELFGDAVVVTTGHERLWSSEPLLRRLLPGYAYAYVGAQLMALILQDAHIAGCESIAPRYLGMLGAGSSRSAAELARMLGIAVEDPQTWQRGLDLFDAQVDAVRVLARETGRLPAPDHMEGASL